MVIPTELKLMANMINEQVKRTIILRSLKKKQSSTYYQLLEIITEIRSMKSLKTKKKIREN